MYNKNNKFTILERRGKERVWWWTQRWEHGTQCWWWCLGSSSVRFLFQMLLNLDSQGVKSRRRKKKKDPNNYLRHAFTLQNDTILNLNRYIYKHTRQSSLLRSGATSRAHTHKIDRNHFKCSLKTDKTDFLYFSFYVNTLKILNGSS